MAVYERIQEKQNLNNSRYKKLDKEAIVIKILISYYETVCLDLLLDLFKFLHLSAIFCWIPVFPPQFFSTSSSVHLNCLLSWPWNIKEVQLKYFQDIQLCTCFSMSNKKYNKRIEKPKILQLQLLPIVSKGFLQELKYM